MADLTTLLSKFLASLYAGAINSATDPLLIQVGGVTKVTVSSTAVTLGSSVSFALGDSTSMSQGAANRLDLASGDSFNLVSGNVSFAGAYAFGMNGTRLAFERGGSYITGFDLFTGSATGVAINGSGSVVLGGSAAELSFGANTGAADVLLSRGAANRLTLATGDVMNLAPTAFASLPTGAEGDLACVTDSNTATWGATVAGGGANNVLAFFNGTDWKVAGA